MGYFYAISSLAGRFSVAYSYDGGLCGGALKEMPVTLKETDGRFLYRLDGAFCHIPPMLSMLWCDL